MLINIDTGKVITRIPHKKSFEAWRKQISTEVHTAGWIPGHDWTETVFYPIYLACKKDTTSAALFFGIIVFIVFMDRPEQWSLGRYQVNDKDIASMTYFRIGR